MIPSLRKALLSAVVLLASCAAYAQTNSYYVVIGAFAKEANAKKFSGFAKSRFFQATYDIHPQRKLYYVYVIKTENKKEAFDQVRILQQESTFSDSWVFWGMLGKSPASQTPVQDAIPLKPDTTNQQPGAIITAIPEVTNSPVKPDTLSQPEISALTDTAADTHSIETPGNPDPSMLPPTRKAKGKYFRFVITSPTGEPFTGKVHHVDLKQGRDIASYTSYAYNDILRPSNRQEPMTIVCGIFGYKEITQVIDYSTPSLTPGVVLDEYEAWNVPFKLERLQKGDVSIMYNVSFYKDAVIMTPRSQEELDELVNMMKANPNYRIRIHGHTNGNSKRKIISLGKNRNYFGIKGSVEKNGTSKQLSEERSEVVRDYLVEHGIEKDRMDIKPWGGSNMLVRETSSSARLNDRIEIEILKD